MKQYSFHRDVPYGVFYSDTDHSLLKQAITVLLGYKVIEHTETIFPQFFYSTLKVDEKAAEVINKKLQLMGWERL